MLNEKEIYELLSEIPDPEIPVITIKDFYKTLFVTLLSHLIKLFKIYIIYLFIIKIPYI